MWRYIKNLPDDQRNPCHTETNSELKMLGHLIRIYFYSDPLDDLTCLFIPVSDGTLIRKYLDWIKNYFYDVNYPTSLLWLYALDSSLASLFPDEIINPFLKTPSSLVKNTKVELINLWATMLCVFS